MASLRMLPVAFADLDRALTWYSQRSETATRRLAAAVEAALDSIEADPFRFAFLIRKYRYLQVRGFPYIIVFVAEKDAVTVVRFRHTSQANIEFDD
jgi:plasmid stabilization system protein ParE